MALWRLHIRPAPKNGKSWPDVVTACITRGIAGIGWPVIGRIPDSAEDYIGIAAAQYKSSIPSIAFARKPQVSDLIWARDLAGRYYLGRIKSDWYYSDTQEDTDLDIPNQRQCDWIVVGNEDHVPGKIVACFRPSRAFQLIKEPAMELFSKWMYNKSSNQVMYPDAIVLDTIDSAGKFFKFISADDCEDIVALYLQKQCGYLIIPSTCKRNTIGYEFVLKHRDTNKTAVVQVKQGQVDLDDMLTGVADHIYLFSTEGKVRAYQDNITILSVDELYTFVLQNHDLIPSKISYWLHRE